MATQVQADNTLTDPEERFLARLSKKYETDMNTGRVRSYVIAGLMILVMFALARFVPIWGISLVIVEILGLAMFHQYKRFGRFKTQLLVKLARERGGA